MKLELKHLAPYLPYNLRVLDGWGDIRTLKYTHLDDETKGSIFQVKPVLRPMSEIESEDYADLKLIDGQYSFDMMDGGKTISWALSGVIGVMDELFKNHFDVFGLIDAGLAIDINTL